MRARVCVCVCVKERLCTCVREPATPDPETTCVMVSESEVHVLMSHVLDTSWHLRTYICVYMYIYVYIHIYPYIYRCVCVCVCTQTDRNTHMDKMARISENDLYAYLMVNNMSLQA